MTVAAISAAAGNAFLYAWFVTVLVSAVYVAYDAFTNNPELTVMKWGWVLVTLYIGPIGASIYVLSCKEPAPGTHEQFVAPLWKQSLGSTIHCVAGDATGIVVATIVTTSIGLPMWGDTIVEYVAGFAFGLLVFQALFMRDMLGGSYLAAVESTVLPEWLSMNGVMAGMVVVMVIIRSHAQGTTDVGDVRFWGVLSLAVLAGLGGRLPGERVAGEEPTQTRDGYGTSPRQRWQPTRRASRPGPLCWPFRDGYEQAAGDARPDQRRGGAHARRARRRRSAGRGARRLLRQIAGEQRGPRTGSRRPGVSGRQGACGPITGR